jgi:8-oxo-dGTP diphosphatase
LKITAKPAVQVAVGAVTINDRSLLLVLRARPPQAGRWSLPGGRVEPGERLEDAVVREVKEETGIDTRCGQLVGWAERISRDFHFVILDFAVDAIGGLATTAGDDAAKAAWVPVDEVLDLELSDGLGDFLQRHGVVPRREGPASG